MWSVRNWVFCLALCLTPAIAKACDAGHAYSKTVHVEPGAAQEIRISRKSVPSGCTYEFELKRGGHIILHFPIVTGKKNSPPPSLNVVGKSGNAIEYKISLANIPAIHRDLQEIIIYHWAAGGDSGFSDISVYGYLDGAVRRLLHLSEGDGSMGFDITRGRLHVHGLMTNSCMACGKSAQMDLRWDKHFGGFVVTHPDENKFAKYLNYQLPGNGVVFGYGKVVDQYRRASAHLLKVYHKLYDPADKAHRDAIRRGEISWIERKRGTCGHQDEALRPGHLAIAECLIDETGSRIVDLESQSAAPIHIAGMAQGGGASGATGHPGKATTATLRKCRNPMTITMNQILFSRLLANKKGYYVVGITSEPYPSLSNGDVDAKHGRDVYCGFRDIYKYTKNPVAMGVQEVYERISYDRFHVVTRKNQLGGVHIVQPGGIQDLKDAWELLNH